MSQEKVNRYKQEKANRKENLKKEKQRSNLIKIGLAVIAVVLIAWLGYSIHNAITKEDTTVQEFDMEALTEYLNSLEAEQKKNTEAGEDTESDAEAGEEETAPTEESVNEEEAAGETAEE